MARGDSRTKDSIIIEGARVNNLKDIDVAIPKNKLVVITGLSGSGKSSLAFDVVYAEGNRRYLEGMSSYARQFLESGLEANVDKIENLSPTISIDQKSIGRSPRSTVGTLTEIYDYLRILFAKIGVPHCPKCGAQMERKNIQKIVDEILNFPDGTSVAILAKSKSGKNCKEMVKNIMQMGYARLRLQGKIMMAKEALLLVQEEVGISVEAVIDRVMIKRKNPDQERIWDSIETALKAGSGSLIVAVDGEEDRMYNKDFVCHSCQVKISEVTPRNFSFNNPEGACPYCSGLGITKEVDLNAIMPHKNISLAEGAILPWSKSNGKSAGQNGYLNILRSLGERYGFSIHDPVKKLSQKAMDIIFYGPEKKEITVTQKNDMGGVKEVKVIFDGVVPMVKRKYEEASSEYIRSELEKYMIEKNCPFCEGKRLREEYLSVMIENFSIDDVVNLSLDAFELFLERMQKSNADPALKSIAAPLVKKMKEKVDALKNVGLHYLSISRRSDSISGGEGQRIRLATQVGSELVGIVYVLDEPSIGLHNRDTEKLIGTIMRLRDLGNSIIVVEHDEDIIRQADWIIDLGPGAGEDGGEVMFSGNFKQLIKSKALTAQYLTGKKNIFEKRTPRKGNKRQLEIVGAKSHNLKNITVGIPLEKFVVITGVSGSGKSTLIKDVLAKALAKHFYNAKDVPGEHKKMKGLQYIDKVIHIDQAPIGRTPRSNAATYTGVFSLIREQFANTSEASKRGYTASRFSFNMKGGRCEVCQGNGTKKIEMHLLPDMYIECEICHGARYNKKTLDIEYQGLNVAEVLDKSISFARNFFRKHPLITEKLKTLEEVGLGYLRLGQSATNLSGGEAQRIKLATELARKATGKTLYILDEPTIGLHFEDVRRLLLVLNALVDKGNTVLVVEHNISVIRGADWVIDLGPEGGDKGGEILYTGIPDKLKKVKRSWTGKYL